MGTVRSYSASRAPSREDNFETRKVIGNSLTTLKRSTLNEAPAPVNFIDERTKAVSPPTYLTKEERPRATRAERTRALRDARKADRTLIDGRLVSNECPCHGEYNGYLNWFCRCIPCSRAASAHRGFSHVKV